MTAAALSPPTIAAATQARLAAIAVTAMARPQETLIAEGGPALACFSIDSGTVRLFKSLPDGRRQITGFVGSGAFISFFGSGLYDVSMSAIDTVRYRRYPSMRWLELIAHCTQSQNALVTAISCQVAAAQDQILLLGRKSAREKVASFLNSQPRRGGVGPNGQERVFLAMSRSDIADYLGLTSETVCRTLSAFKNEGIIAMPRLAPITVILDQLKLRLIADNSFG